MIHYLWHQFNVVMNALEIQVIERLIVPNVGLTEEDTVDKRKDVMLRSLEIGQNLK